MAKQPEPWRDLEKVILELRRRVAELERRSPYTGTGMAPNGANGIEVDGDFIIDGNLDLNGSGVVSGTLRSEAFDGDLTTGAPGTTGWAASNDKMIVPQLILRPGSVDNDALANPVIPKVARASTSSGFSLPNPATLAELAGVNVTVPTGCTQLLATVSGSVFAFNPNTTGGADGSGADAIYCNLRLGGQSSRTTLQGVTGSGGYATASGDESFIFTGLSGGSTLRLGVWGASGYQSIASNSNNYALVSASLIFLR